MSTPLPQIPRWKNYDPQTGIGDPSTPLNDSNLNGWSDAVQEFGQAAVDRAEAAAEAAEAPTDATLGVLLNTPGSQTRAALDDYSQDSIIPEAVAQVGTEFIPRVPSGAIALPYAALAFTGSPRTGNVGVGSRFAEPQPFATSNAFPALAMDRTGRLVAMWRRAQAHGRGFHGDLYQTVSDDLGASWSTPAVAISDITLDYRDPALATLSDGRLAVVFFADDGVKASGGFIAFSSDAGTSWSTPVPLGFDRAFSNATSGPVVELSNGTLLVCGYGAITQANDTAQMWDVRVRRSTDGGATWSPLATIANGPADGRPYSETWMGVLPNGNLMALIRCDSTTKTIYRSTSSDGGATWTAPSAILSAGGRPSWVRLASGGIVLTYRRNADSLAEYVTSWDSGLTWSSPALLDDTGGGVTQSVYQQPVQLAPGLVGVVYADELTASSSRVRYRHLLDGVGFSPLGDARVTTTGGTVGAWTPITPATGWRAYTGVASFLPAWRIKDNMVEIRPGIVQPTGSNVTAAAGAGISISAALPSNVWPPNTGARGGGTINLTTNAPTAASFYVTTAGVLTAIPSTSGTMTADAGNAQAAVPYITWPLP